MSDKDTIPYFSISSTKDEETQIKEIQRINDEISSTVVKNIKNISATNNYTIKLSTLQNIFNDSQQIETQIQKVSTQITNILIINGYPGKNIKITIDIDDAIHALPQKIDPTLVNNLVYFEGTICKISPTKPRLMNFIFECVVCNLRKIIDNEDDRYATPEPYCRCKKHKFVLNDKETVLKDIQEVKIRIKDNNEYFIGEIFDIKVNLLVPGDNIKGVGVVKIGNESRGYFKTYLEINNFVVCTGNKVKEKNISIPNTEIDDTENFYDEMNKPQEVFLSKHEEINYKYFFEMSKDECIFSILLNNVYNDVYGYEEIKAGLLLALVSGSSKNKRNAINVLMIGDPGLGKSKLLLKTSEIVPKSIYICGNNTTTAGLTVSLSVDPSTGDYAVDAGALVMADNGICLIDEFDKIPDHRALKEVMEDGNLCYNKGGIYYTLQVNTSIIGATNPKNGHFDKNKSLKENVKFDDALLSRFDLIYVMFDEYDYRKIKDIMQIKTKSQNIDENSTFKREDIAQKIINLARNDSFILKLNKSSEKYSMDLIKKYINFCKENINPILSIKAKKILKEYYLSIRQKDCVNIRTLESLIRLTEAYTKIHIRGICSEKDAIFIVELHKRTCFNKNTIKKRKIIDVLKERKGDSISKIDIECIMNECNVQKDVESFIEMLNSQGILIKTGTDKFRIDI